MKLFGEYLVEQNLISKHELVNVLLEQIKNIPSMAECVYDAKLLSDDDLLETLKYQASNYVDLLSALKALNKWNEVLEKKIKIHMQEKRIPLGQLLVKQGKIEFDALAKHLDDFIYECKKGNTKEENTSLKNMTPNLSRSSEDLVLKSEDELSENKHNEIMPPELTISNYNPEFASIDTIFLEGFFEIFNPKVMDNNACLLENTNDGSISDLTASFNSILLGARFIQANLVHDLAEELVNSMKAVIHPGKKESSAIVKNANELFRKLHKELSTNGSELGFWENSENKKEFVEVLTVLRNCRAIYEETKCAS